MSEVKVNKLSPRSGTTVTIGDSGDTINIVGTLQNNGSVIPGDISSVVAEQVYHVVVHLGTLL